MTVRQFFGIQSATKGTSFAAHNHHPRLGTLRKMGRRSDQILYPGTVGSIEHCWTIEP
jgi:hypothetical protein